MTEEATKVMELVREGQAVTVAIKNTGLTQNQYYRYVPEGDRLIVGIARAEYLMNNAVVRKCKKKREYQLQTSALPKELKSDFVLLAKGLKQSPATLLSILVRKAVREAKKS